MSKLAKKPVLVPKGVEWNFASGALTVKGPKGSLTRQIPKGINIVKNTHGVLIQADDGVHLEAAMLGLYRSLIQGMIIGVSVGFVKKLSLVGVGYRAALQGTNLELQVGFSNPIKLPVPKSIKVAVDKNVSIAIEGIDKHLVGQFAADVRAQKPPEPYKGKGIRYEDEYVRKKAGKTGKGK